MLREYLSSAQEVLEAKREIYDVKHQRLLLAQEEYNHLNALAASRSSRKFIIIVFIIQYIEYSIGRVHKK